MGRLSLFESGHGRELAKRQPDTGLRLLDLFCCAGGAGLGYSRAGFEVVGVDISDQPNYPFEFLRHDAMALEPEFLSSSVLFRSGEKEWQCSRVAAPY
jgi:hypothetical protein